VAFAGTIDGEIELGAFFAEWHAGQVKFEWRCCRIALFLKFFKLVANLPQKKIDVGHKAHSLLGSQA